MSKQVTTPEQQAINAVKQLLSQQDIQEYLDELDLMHGSFLRTHFADDLNTRSRVASTYENIREFLYAVSDVDRVRLAG